MLFCECGARRERHQQTDQWGEAHNLVAAIGAWGALSPVKKCPPMSERNNRLKPACGVNSIIGADTHTHEHTGGVSMDCLSCNTDCPTTARTQTVRCGAARECGAHTTHARSKQRARLWSRCESCNYTRDYANSGTMACPTSMLMSTRNQRESCPFSSRGAPVEDVAATRQLARAVVKLTVAERASASLVHLQHMPSAAASRRALKHRAFVRVPTRRANPTRRSSCAAAPVAASVASAAAAQQRPRRTGLRSSGAHRLESACPPFAAAG